MRGLRFGVCVERSRSCARLAVVALACAMTGGAFAHETDQYSVPVGRQFADLRFYFSEQVYDVLRAAVDRANARIRGSMRGGQTTDVTRRLQSADAIGDAVYAEFPSPISHVEELELELREPDVQSRFPGLVVAYMPAVWIYHHWALLLDPTKLPRLWRCSTVLINGTYAGTDKFVHFVHMGRAYFLTYRSAVAAGASPAEATRKAVELGTGADPLSERSLLGLLATGVMSNGDLASDFAGLLFYRNLSESVRIAGTMQAPLVVRDGEFFRLHDHVRRDRDFFSVFVSDHWDEVLNPNVYQFGMDVWLKEEVRRRCADVLDWYRDERGLPWTRQHFVNRFHELSTYFGEDYGHTGEIGDLVSAANGCFSGQEGATPPRRADDLDALGRTALWPAARGGRIEDVRACLDGRMDVNRADIDGETALHAATREGRAEIVRLLVAHGGHVKAKSNQGVTPLHLAVQGGGSEVVEMLLKSGASPNDRDAFGRTPLHDAAVGSNPTLAMLLRAGGDPNAPDLSGSTPLHLAAREGSPAVVSALLAAGGSLEARNASGRTPLGEAQAGRNRRAEELLNGDRGVNSHRPSKGGRAGRVR